MWERHMSRWRYLRHLREWPTSRLSIRIFPNLCIVVIWSILSVCLDSLNGIHIPLTTLSLLSTFVAALLTLRSNQGLNRLSEGRHAFGRVVNNTRDFAHLLKAYVYPKDQKLAMLLFRYVSVFGWTLKGHLRQSDESDVVETLLASPKDVAFVLSARKQPVAVLAALREGVASLSERKLLQVPQHSSLEKNIMEMSNIVMTCERIQASPIPSVYTAHASRLLIVYLTTLPLALRGTAMAKIPTILVTTLVGFAMLGLDEISHFLEEPFQLMPLYQLSKISTLDVSDAIVCPCPILEQAEEATTANFEKPDYW